MWNVFGSTMKTKEKWRKVAFGRRERSCFDERERGQRNFANQNKQGHKVYENTLKDANDI